MKLVRIVCFAALGLMWATTVQATHNASSGVIHFVGQIVEEGCGTQLQRTQKLGTIAQRSIPGHPELREMTITYY